MNTTTKSVSDILKLACELIEKPSVTPDDCGCQNILKQKLETLNFTITDLPFGKVSNFWAKRGTGNPLLVFAGHTDVVPTGPWSEWNSNPFTPTIEGDLLYGRGSADMKGSLAAMIVAAEQFVNDHPNYAGSLGFLITSDEEGDAFDGTKRVVDYLQTQGEKIDWCIVGEPSSSKTLGDIIRNGRRGSLSGILRILGQQGHVAYPHLADNAVHRGLQPLHSLSQEVWDQGNEFFPATSFQISNIHAGQGAHNVVPGETDIIFNFRFSTEVTVAELKQRTETVLNHHNLSYEIEWRLFGEPFFTAPGILTNAVCEAIQKITKTTAELSTAGGTSDGRFIAPTGAQVVELGPVNASIHQVNEHVSIKELQQLSKLYYQIMHDLLNS